MDNLGSKTFLLILIMSLQEFLLHGKILRAAKHSPIGSNSSESSSCSPNQYQVDYYEQLYNSVNVANSFNGNIMYYALKGIRVNNNRNGSTVTAENNTTIANITDHGRFTPAGMELASKVVCAQILQEMDGETSIISETALCPWDYICDYKADRYPHYLFKARCKTSLCLNCNQEQKRHNMCQSHGIHVSVLQMRNSCEEWVWGQELVPIACTCTNDFIMRAL